MRMTMNMFGASASTIATAPTADHIGVGGITSPAFRGSAHPVAPQPKADDVSGSALHYSDGDGCENATGLRLSRRVLACFEAT